MATAKRTPPAPTGSKESSAFEHRFTGTFETLDLGRMVYRVIYLSKALQARPPFDTTRRFRMEGTVAGHPCFLAWQRANGRHYLLVGTKLARATKMQIGDRVEVCFSLVDDEAVRIPAELAEALRQEPAWKKLWKGLTPGTQRGLSHMVESAKKPETRVRRAVDIMRAVEAGETPRPPPRRRDGF